MKNKKYLITIAVLLAMSLPLVIWQNQKSDPSDSAPAADPTENSAEAEDPPSETADPELAALIQKFAEGHRGKYAVAVREIGGQNRRASYQSGQPMVAASTYKLFLTYIILHEIETGSLSLDYKLPNGQTVEHCIDRLLVVSSDDCAWRLGNIVGWHEVDERLKQRGFSQTKINNYDAAGEINSDKLTTADDQAELLWRLASHRLLSPAHTDFFLDKLKNQVWRQRIPAGVPEGIEVADKPGWLEGIENDSGIVYGSNSTYVLVIMTENGRINDLAELSKLIYEYMN